MALERYAQRTGRFSGQADDVAFGVGERRHDRAREREQPVAGLGQFDGLALAPHSGNTVMRLDRAQLVG